MNEKGGTVLGVGIDWSEDANQVALGKPGEGVVEEFSVPHRPEAVARLIEHIGALEPEAAEVRVALETKHGHLVEALLEAGYAVVPVNPDLVARRRGPARKKDDGEDARILCVMALDRYHVLRPLVPHGEVAAELRVIARDDERAARDERRLLNRLRADLLAAFPAALDFAGADLGAPSVLRLLERYPTAQAAARATDAELEALFRQGRHGWPDRAVGRLAHNHHLGNAVQQWAFCSLGRSGWAREFYDAQRARNKGHHAALRALGNRWLEVLWHCLKKGVLYNEAVHVQNRTKALGMAA